MKTATYKDMNPEELRSREAELRKSLFNLRARAASKELENVSRIRQEKRELARVLTRIQEKQQAAS
jgi:large subunit ribosomal protein L29